MLLRYNEKCSDSTSSELKSNHCWVTQWQSFTKKQIHYYQDFVPSLAYGSFFTPSSSGASGTVSFTSFVLITRAGIVRKRDNTICRINHYQHSWPSDVILMPFENTRPLALSVDRPLAPLFSSYFFRGVVVYATLKLDLKQYLHSGLRLSEHLHQSITSNPR